MGDGCVLVAGVVGESYWGACACEGYGVAVVVVGWCAYLGVCARDELVCLVVAVAGGYAVCSCGCAVAVFARVKVCTGLVAGGWVWGPLWQLLAKTILQPSRDCKNPNKRPTY